MLPKPDQLPHLLSLLDDPSETVRNALAREFAAFGPDLEDALSCLARPITDGERSQVEGLMATQRDAWIEESWAGWLSAPETSDMERLEDGLTIVAQYQQKHFCRGPLTALLDRLADDFRQHTGPWDAVALAQYLFQTRGFRGARSDYYHPRNSNLMYVLEHRRGIPITLAIVYMLVGHRVGLHIEGCNWPGHFYARIWVNGVPTLVDAFNGGNCLDEDSFLRMQGPSRDAARTVVRGEVNADAIVQRVLHNLVRAYQQAGEWESSQQMVNLLRRMKAQPSPASE